MNILGTCRHLLQYLSMSPAAASSEPKAEKEIEDPADGPGAGGGYEDSVEIEDPGDADGPGAGGGYDKLETEDPADGPGAGGGYDDLGDDDGPGAGGGYHTLYKTDASARNPWTTASASYLGQEWLLESAPEAANSNKVPAKKPAKGDSK